LFVALSGVAFSCFLVTVLLPGRRATTVVSVEAAE